MKAVVFVSTKYAPGDFGTPLPEDIYREVLFVARDKGIRLTKSFTIKEAKTKQSGARKFVVFQGQRITPKITPSEKLDEI